MHVVVGDWPRINAERQLDSLAVIDATRRLSWEQLDARVNALCHVVLGLPGHSVGRRVGILADNCSEHLELMFAASRARFIHTGLNTRHTVVEMANQLADGQVDVLLVGPEYVETALELRAQRPGLLLIGLAGADLERSYEDLLAQAGSTPVPAHGDAEEVYSLVYTSGSTGEPKGVMVSSRNERAYGQSVAWTVELRHADCVLNVAPLFHRGGQFFSMMCAQYGTPLVLMKAFDPDQMLTAMQREEVSLILVVPTMLKVLVEHLEKSESDRYDLSSLRLIMCGSAPLSSELTNRLLNIVTTDLCQCAGMSEGAFTMSLTSGDYRAIRRDPSLEHRIASVGRVVPGFRVGIVDEDDNFVPDGVAGELVYQGDAFVQGYWGRPEASARAWRNGWFHSGDVGRRDADGYIYYIDRLFGRIKTGAETVYSREVEQIFEGHPEIAEVAVVGMPDEHWGEAVTAAVVLAARDDGASDLAALEDRLRSFAENAGLSRYKLPKRYSFVDALPRTSTGKVAYAQVKDLVASAAAPVPSDS